MDTTITRITCTRPLDGDVVVPKRGMFDPELTYYADGTRVARKGHPEIVGTTAGMTVDAVPYQFQVVEWDGGQATNTAPHVLVKIEEASKA